jgi:hypothetical protein
LPCVGSVLSPASFDQRNVGLLSAGGIAVDLPRTDGASDANAAKPPGELLPYCKTAEQAYNAGELLENAKSKIVVRPSTYYV